MKPETRTTPSSKEPGPRVATVPPPAPPSAPTTDLEAELLALAQEEEALRKRKTEKRQSYWDVTIATVTRSIEQLTAHGFDRGAVARALGFVPNAKSTSAPKKGTGPSTHDGWYALFVTTGVRSYLKAHPDLATKLKSSKVAPAEYGSHLPEPAFTAIKTTARQKAESKCPASTPTEVVSK
jgi:hypothetical protein